MFWYCFLTWYSWIMIQDTELYNMIYKYLIDYFISIYAYLRYKSLRIYFCYNKDYLSKGIVVASVLQKMNQDHPYLNSTNNFFLLLPYQFLYFLSTSSPIHFLIFHSFRFLAFLTILFFLFSLIIWEDPWYVNQRKIFCYPICQCPRFL